MAARSGRPFPCAAVVGIALVTTVVISLLTTRMNDGRFAREQPPTLEDVATLEAEHAALLQEAEALRAHVSWGDRPALLPIDDPGRRLYVAFWHLSEAASAIRRLERAVVRYEEARAKEHPDSAPSDGPDEPYHLQDTGNLGWDRKTARAELRYARFSIEKARAAPGEK